MTDSTEFDWSEVDVVAPEQQRIAVYLNPAECIVVRQDGDWHRREDPWIVIRPENAKQVADAIMALAIELGAVRAPARPPLALPAPAPADRTGAERQRRYRERKRDGQTVTPRDGNGSDLFGGAPTG